MEQKSRRIWPNLASILAISTSLAVLIWGYGGEDLFYCAIASIVLLVAAAPILLRNTEESYITSLLHETWFRPALLLGLLACGSLFSSANIFRTLVALFFWVVLFFTYLLTSRLSFRHRITMLGLLLAVSTAYTLFGFFQRAGIFDSSFWYNGVFASRFGNSNHFSALAAVSVVISISLITFLRTYTAKALAACTLPLNLVAIVYTETRAIWALLAILLIWLIALYASQMRRQRGRLLVTIVLLAVCFAAGAWIFREPVANRIRSFSSDDWSSVNHRLSMWDNACNVIKHNPQGVGLGAYGYASLQHKTSLDRFHAYRAHNEPLQITSELGWLAAPLLLWLLVGLTRSLHRGWRDNETNPGERMVTLCVAACTLLFFLHSLVDFPLRLRANLLTWVVLLACASTPGKTTVLRNGYARLLRFGMRLVWLAAMMWWILLALSQSAWRSAEPFVHEGLYNEALTHLEVSSRWMPLHARVQFELGRAYLARSTFDGSEAGDRDRIAGLDALLRSARIAPHWAETHLRIARAYETLSDQQQAEVHYLRAIESDPVMAVYRMHYANYLFDQGRRDEAAIRYRDAFESFSDDNPHVSWRTTMRKVYDATHDPIYLRQCFPETQAYDRHVSRFLEREARRQ